MDRAPDGDRVPLGPAVQQRGRLRRRRAPRRRCRWAPPGLIVLLRRLRRPRVRQRPRADPAVYLTDPHRPGERLYRGGDYGRWPPDGKLEFLGRRDIAGQDLRFPDRDRRDRERPAAGARVSTTRRWWSPSGPTSGKHLVAFYAGEQEIEVEVLRERLGRSLPRLHGARRRSTGGTSLPLTANGKIDTKALTALAAELEVVAEEDDAPRTATEQRLAAAWAKVLGVAGGPDRPAGPLLRPRWLVVVGGEAGDRAEARRSRSRTSPGTRCSPTWPR